MLIEKNSTEIVSISIAGGLEILGRLTDEEGELYIENAMAFSFSDTFTIEPKDNYEGSKTMTLIVVSLATGAYAAHKITVANNATLNSSL